MAIETVNWDQPPPGSCRNGAVSIGNFDGVHRGHAALIAQLRVQARKVSGPAVVLTFDPHPLQLLRPEQFQPLLTTIGDRAELLQTAGADHVVIVRTTHELLHLTAEEFFAQVVQGRLQARALVEGVNFGFGRDRGGNIDTLSRLCQRAGLALTVVPPLQVEGIIVSSSRVRGAINRGEARVATNLLGRPFRLWGRVGTGQKRGRTLGFPTANLTQIETLIPRDGVYAVHVLHDGQTWPGAANIGPNPTFGEQVRKVEVHLIGFTGELVGQMLAVDFLERLRDTRPFTGAEQLTAQLRADVEQARQIARL